MIRYYFQSEINRYDILVYIKPTRPLISRCAFTSVRIFLYTLGEKEKKSAKIFHNSINFRECHIK